MDINFSCRKNSQQCTRVLRLIKMQISGIRHSHRLLKNVEKIVGITLDGINVAQKLMLYNESMLWYYKIGFLKGKIFEEKISYSEHTDHTIFNVI